MTNKEFSHILVHLFRCRRDIFKPRSNSKAENEVPTCRLGSVLECKYSSKHQAETEEKPYDYYVLSRLAVAGLEWCVVVALLFYVHCKHLRSCRDGRLI